MLESSQYFHPTRLRVASSSIILNAFWRHTLISNNLACTSKQWFHQCTLRSYNNDFRVTAFLVPSVDVDAELYLIIEIITYQESGGWGSDESFPSSWRLPGLSFIDIEGARAGWWVVGGSLSQALSMQMWKDVIPVLKKLLNLVNEV